MSATDIEGVGAKTFSVSLVEREVHVPLRRAPDLDEGHLHGGNSDRAASDEDSSGGIPRTYATWFCVPRRTGLSLTTAAGARVKALSAGPAVITVRDRSTLRGMRLIGAGVNRKSGVGFVGTATWKVTLTRGHARLLEHRPSPRSAAGASSSPEPRRG